MRRRLALVLLALGGVIASGVPAAAQETPPSTVAELPPSEIVPRPNSGQAPTEAGDRGGALQLGLLALVVVVLLGGVLHLVRQSQRHRAAGASDQPSSR